MIRKLLLAALTCFAGVNLFSAAAAEEVPQRYIVVLKDDLLDINGVIQLLSQTNNLLVGRVFKDALSGFAADLTTAQVQALRASSEVQFVAENKPMHLDSQTLPTGVQRIGGNHSSQHSGNGSGTFNGPAVAVVDTGISIIHPDLNVQGGVSCVDDTIDDGVGHGSHVAGIIGARDNAIGVVGVAPGARLYAVKVFDADSNGDTESIVCGLDWIAHNAASLGIRVVNMSLGGDGFDDHLCGLLNGDPEHQAICKLVDLKGLTVVVAAGNDAKDAASVIPASYDEVITVSALSDFNGAPGGGAPATCGANIDDTLYNKSNFGPDIDFIAPGSCITSTSTGTGYDLRSGTSMAAPHVAGAALLYLRLLPIATPGLVKLGLQLQANYDWDNSTDPDGIKEPLIDVSHL